MNLKVKYNLWVNKYRISAGSKFKKELWGNLSNHWQEVYGNNYRWYQTFAFRMAVASLVGVMVLGSFVTGAYAYNSPEVTPDNILYPVKQGLENVVSVIKVTPAAKAKFYLKTIKKREDEKKVMEKRNPIAAQKVIENTEKQIGDAEEKLVEVNKQLLDSDKPLKEKVQKQLEKRQERLQQKIEKTKERENNKGRDNNFDQSSGNKKTDEEGGD